MNVGTQDNNTFSILANNVAAFRVVPTTTIPNLIGGSASNFVTGGVAAAVVSGGGSSGTTNDPIAGAFCGTSCANRVTDYGGHVGGGVGIRYRDETPPALDDYARVLLDRMQGRTEKLIVEPGRSLVGNAGWLLTRVEYLKHGEAKDFAIVDAAMNDLMRPALYDAWHDILPVTPRAGEPHAYDVVGPVCETGDFLGLARPLCIEAGDLRQALEASSRVPRACFKSFLRQGRRARAPRKFLRSSGILP